MHPKTTVPRFLFLAPGLTGGTSINSPFLRIVGKAGPSFYASFCLPSIVLRHFGGKYTISNVSKGQSRYNKRCSHPEVLNRKLIFVSEYRPVRRTVLQVLFNHPDLKVLSHFCRLHEQQGAENHSSERASSTVPEKSSGPDTSITGFYQTLTGPGPFTCFFPTNAAFEKLHPSSIRRLTKYPEVLSCFLASHLVLGFWRFRDLVGSPAQPWLAYNEHRDVATALNNLGGGQIQIQNVTPHFTTKEGGNRALDLELIRSYLKTAANPAKESKASDKEESSSSSNHLNNNSANNQIPGELASLNDWRSMIELGDHNARLYRTELRCHNGIAHFVDAPLGGVVESNNS